MHRQQDAYYFQKPNRVVHSLRTWCGDTNKTDPPQVLAERLHNGHVGLYPAHPTNILTLAVSFQIKRMFEEVDHYALSSGPHLLQANTTNQQKLLIPPLPTAFSRSLFSFAEKKLYPPLVRFFFADQKL